MKNIFKGWITTLIGIVVIVATFYGIYKGNIEWVWNGVAGVCLGVILLFSKPTFLEKNFDLLVSKFTK